MAQLCDGSRGAERGRGGPELCIAAPRFRTAALATRPHLRKLSSGQRRKRRPRHVWESSGLSRLKRRSPEALVAFDLTSEAARSQRKTVLPVLPWRWVWMSECVAGCDSGARGLDWTRGFVRTPVAAVAADTELEAPLAVACALLNSLVRGEIASLHPLLLPGQGAPPSAAAAAVPEGRIIVRLSAEQAEAGLCSRLEQRCDGLTMPGGHSVAEVLGAAVSLRPGLGERATLSCLLHELGHALGLAHPLAAKATQPLRSAGGSAGSGAPPFGAPTSLAGFDMVSPGSGGMPAAGSVVLGEAVWRALRHLYALPEQRVFGSRECTDTPAVHRRTRELGRALRDEELAGAPKEDGE